MSDGCIWKFELSEGIDSKLVLVAELNEMIEELN